MKLGKKKNNREVCDDFFEDDSLWMQYSKPLVMPSGKTLICHILLGRIIFKSYLPLQKSECTHVERTECACHAKMRWCFPFPSTPFSEINIFPQPRNRSGVQNVRITARERRERTLQAVPLERGCNLGERFNRIRN
ncbi:hypothetical protein CEXT_262621 [Caerostris extrusa]|uniref:Uncharacterized protein n=1 Tax=Caerostris extrusa TaxID=172846 RepID=A0AAV4R4L4_CAEEX|nr:hypothetical protein CEXT_262621 [Caerostris extrusa]